MRGGKQDVGSSVEQMMSTQCGNNTDTVQTQYRRYSYMDTTRTFCSHDADKVQTQHRHNTDTTQTQYSRHATKEIEASSMKHYKVKRPISNESDIQIVR